MKKYIIYAVALLSAVACSEAPVEVPTIDPGTSNTEMVKVRLIAENPGSRVTVDTEENENGDWELQWDKGDELTLLNSSTQETYVLFAKDASGDDAARFDVAEFEGEVAAGEYTGYLVGDNSKLDGDVLNAIYDNQTPGCNNPLMSTSITIDAADGVVEEALSFTHEFTMVEVNAIFDISLADLGYISPYTLERLELMDLDAKSLTPQIVSVQTSKALTAVDPTNGDYRLCASVTMTAPQFYVKNGEAVKAKAVLKDSYGKIIFAEGTTANAGEDITFEAGTHNSLNVNFTTAPTGSYWNAGTIRSDKDFTTATATEDGTEAKPYQITSAADLGKLAYDVSYEGKAFDNVYFKQTVDIDLSAHSWAPIGNSNNKFKGKYNGDNKKISGLYFNYSTSLLGGLFGEINNATIENVNLYGNIYSTNSTTAKNYLGGIVGYAEGTTAGGGCTISNCTFSGSVKGCGNSVVSCGGILGYGEGVVTVESCDNSGSVTGLPMGSSKPYAGGIAGVIESEDAEVTECTNSGKVISEASSAGGIVGFAKDGAKVSDSSNSGSISVTDDTETTKCGGIVGHSDASTVNYCENSGKINGLYNAGGIVGYNYDSTVINSSNSGIVILDGSKDSSTCGGVVGENIQSKVVNSYNHGTLICNSPSASNGGVVGSNFSVYSTYPAVVNNCYNTGTITINNTGSTQNGCIVGDNSSSDASVENCIYLEGVGLNVTGNDGTTSNCTSVNSKEAMKSDVIKTDLNNYAATYNNSLSDGDPVAYGWNYSSDLYPYVNETITPTTAN